MMLEMDLICCTHTCGGHSAPTEGNLPEPVRTYQNLSEPTRTYQNLPEPSWEVRKASLALLQYDDAAAQLGNPVPSALKMVL